MGWGAPGKERSPGCLILPVCQAHFGVLYLIHSPQQPLEVGRHRKPILPMSLWRLREKKELQQGHPAG